MCASCEFGAADNRDIGVSTELHHDAVVHLLNQSPLALATTRKQTRRGDDDPPLTRGTPYQHTATCPHVTQSEVIAPGGSPVHLPSAPPLGVRTPLQADEQQVRSIGTPRSLTVARSCLEAEEARQAAAC